MEHLVFISKHNAKDKLLRPFCSININCLFKQILIEFWRSTLCKKLLAWKKKEKLTQNWLTCPPVILKGISILYLGRVLNVYFGCAFSSWTSFFASNLSIQHSAELLFQMLCIFIQFSEMLNYTQLWSVMEKHFLPTETHGDYFLLSFKLRFPSETKFNIYESSSWNWR